MSTTVSVSGLDQAIELSERFTEELKTARATHQEMLESLQSLTGEAPVQAKSAKPTKTKAANSKPKKPVTSSKRGRKPASSDGISLREAVWQIFSRKEGSKFVQMKVADVIKTIKSEKTWTTDGDLGNMVHGAVYKLKKEGKLQRNDDKTYNVVSGATLED